MTVKKLGVLLLAILLVIPLCYCSDSKSKSILTADRSYNSGDNANLAETDSLFDTEKPVEDNISEYLKQMTIEEKVGQMIVAERQFISAQDVKNFFVGSVFASGGSSPEENNLEEWRSMIRRYKDAVSETRLAIPLIFGIDAVHGNNNMKDTVIFPHNIALGASGDPELVKKIAAATADELNAIGIDWTFSPCVAVSNDIRWGRTYECFSENPDLVTIMAIPAIETLQEKGIISCIKHYVADGAVLFGTGDNGYIMDRGNANIGFRDLNDNYISVYREAVLAGVESIMVSYSSVNNEKNHSNRYLIQDVLKGDIGFTGIVVSDYEGIHDLKGDGLYQQVTDAVNAGVDVLMEGEQWKACYESILRAVEKKDITIKRIDDAVGRVLRVKMESGFFTNEQNKVKSQYKGDYGFKLRNFNNTSTAEEAVRKSLVLLKNKNGILPLKKSAKIAVIGPAADDIGVQCGGWTKTWQGGVDDERGRWMSGTTILDGFQDIAGTSGGTIITDTKKLNQADVVVAVLGEYPYAEGKGDDGDMGIDSGTVLEQNRLTLANAYNSGKPIVIVLVSGRPRIITQELEKWDGLVEAWLPGTEGEAIAPVLYGDYEFSGMLPVTWPKSVKQLPLTMKNQKDGYDALFQYGFGMSVGD